MAKDKNIKIFSIGMGTEKGAMIPIKDNRGNIISYKKDQNGDNVITKMYPETLKSISDKTKAKYINGSNTKEVVEAVKSQLDKIEKTEKTDSETFTGNIYILKKKT